MSHRLLTNYRFNPVAAMALVAVTVALGYVVISSFAATTVTSVKSGNWSDSTVWNGGKVPTNTDTAVINANHTVTFDSASAKVAGMEVKTGGTLTFDPNKSTTLESSANVLINGTLVMKPKDATINQTLRFINVNEASFVGGGMDPVASDVGLWVMGNGKLDIVGTARSGWLRATDTINQGANTVTLQSVPTGWRVGDEIIITPTEHPNVGDASWNGFEERTISAISGATVTLNSPTSRAHPMVNNKWTAEVANLTRNVRIEGTGDGSLSPGNNGRTHILIRSGVPQTIKHAQIRHVGPRQNSGSATTLVLGRYGLHFHHSMDGSRGSIVEGVVIRDAGNRSFVPHASHGITMRDSVAYDVYEDAYWWDLPTSQTDSSNNSNDTLWEHNIAALVKADTAGDRQNLFELTGFNLGAGLNNTIRDSVGVGVQGNVNASAFHWPSHANHQPNVWTFESNNIGHNNRNRGIFVWQNTPFGPHNVTNFALYRNGTAGIQHGAYLNAYAYSDMELYDNGDTSIELHALPGNLDQELRDREDGYVMVFERFTANTTLRIVKHALASEGGNVLFKDCSVPDVVIAEVVLSGKYDFVNCGLEASDFDLQIQLPGSEVRVQRADGTAFRINDAGQVSTIAKFYTFEGTTPPPDTTLPTVSLTAPAADATVSGNVNLAASASDNVAVTRVEFLVDGSVVSTDTTSPYSFSWDSTSAGNGSHTISARAFDAAGNTRTSTVITVTVDNQGEIIPGDLNGDNAVNVFDLSLLLSKWGTSDAAYDLNGNGTVDIFDLSILLSNWGS